MITEIIEMVKKNKGAAIGLGICIPLIIIIGVVAGFYIVKKKKAAEAKDPMKKEKDLEKQKQA